VADGTEATTKLVTKLNSTGASATPYQMAVLNNLLMFSAKTENEGTELWKTDGTDNGTQLVKDIYPGFLSGNLLRPTVMGNNLFFTAFYKEPFVNQVWKSDGTTAGTQLLKNIYEGLGGSSTEGLVVLNNKLIFNAYRLLEGEELWISDGTDAGTKLLKDINPTGQSQPIINQNCVILRDSLLFFNASDGVNGTELWKTNGTPEGTSMVANIRLRDQEPTNYYVHVNNMTKVGDKMFFSADDGVVGAELWITDGTTVGTKLVKDINPGLVPSYPYALINYNGVLYFTADNGINGAELWKSDGTAAGTVLVKDITAGIKSALPYNMTIHKNTLYFVISDNGSGSDELWKSDGTTTGTVRVKKVSTSNVKSSIQNVFSYDKYLYFSANDGITGHELWRTDGTDTGTVRIIDLFVGSASSNPSEFIVYKNMLYFNADDGIIGRELWRLSTLSSISVALSPIAEILVFPNPASQYLTIRQKEWSATLQTRLLDSQGKEVVHNTPLKGEATDMDISALTNGLYLLEVTDVTTAKRYCKKIYIVR
jgi:trimeric autotransporter adhesin